MKRGTKRVLAVVLSVATAVLLIPFGGKQAHAVAAEEIEAINIALDAPVVGADATPADFSDDADFEHKYYVTVSGIYAPDPNDDLYYVALGWSRRSESNRAAYDGRFTAGEVWTYTVDINALDGYRLTENTDVTIGGKAAEFEGEYYDDPNGANIYHRVYSVGFPIYDLASNPFLNLSTGDNALGLTIVGDMNELVSAVPFTEGEEIEFALAEGAGMNVIVEDAAGNVPEEEQAAILQEVANNSADAIVVGIYNIQPMLSVGGNSREIHELRAPMNLHINAESLMEQYRRNPTPSVEEKAKKEYEELKQYYQKYMKDLEAVLNGGEPEGSFAMVRSHYGTSGLNVTTLPLGWAVDSYGNAGFGLASDQYSTYTLIYIPKKAAATTEASTESTTTAAKAAAPKTGDSEVPFAALAILGLAAVAGAYSLRKFVK